MAEMGRPTEYTDERKAEIEALLSDYIENTEIPIVAEFAYQNDIPRRTLYKHFRHTLEKLIDKKETQLERLGLNNDVNPTIAKFSLAQLGWSDKAESVIKTIDDDGKETGFKFVTPPDAST